MVFRSLLILLSLLAAADAAAGKADTVHKAVTEWTRALGGWLDARLAGVPYPTSHNRTQLKLGMRTLAGRLTPAERGPIIGLRLHLPQLQKRLNLIIQQEIPREQASRGRSDIERSIQPSGRDEATFVGLRLSRGEHGFSRYLSNLSVGAVFKGVEPGLALDWRQRDRYAIGRGWVRTDFQRLRWESFLGLYGTLGHDFDYAPSPQQLRRLSLSLTGYLESETVELNLSAGETWWLAQGAELSLRLHCAWTSQPRIELAHWGPSIHYSRPVWHPWLLLTVMPEVRFDRRYGYRTDPRLTMKMEALF